MSWTGLKLMVTLHILGAVRPIVVSQVTRSYQSKFIVSMKPARPLPPVSRNDLARALALAPSASRKLLTSVAKGDPPAALRAFCTMSVFVFWVGVRHEIGMEYVPPM